MSLVALSASGPATWAFLRAFRLLAPLFLPTSRQIVFSMSSDSLLLRPYLTPSSGSQHSWFLKATRTSSGNEPQGLRRGKPCAEAISLVLPLMAIFSRWLVAPHFCQMVTRCLCSLLSWATLLTLASCATVNGGPGGGGRATTGPGANGTGRVPV